MFDSAAPADVLTALAECITRLHAFARIQTHGVIAKGMPRYVAAPAVAAYGRGVTDALLVLFNSPAAQLFDVAVSAAVHELDPDGRTQEGGYPYVPVDLSKTRH